MAASRSLRGMSPAALTRASSMPEAQKSATIFSIPMGAASPAARSASCRWIPSERSSSTSKAPQEDLSPGIGLAASHMALAYPAKSVQAPLAGSRSATPKRIGAASLLSSSFQVGAAVAAAVFGSLARLHPACPKSAAAMAGNTTNRSIVLEVIMAPRNSIAVCSGAAGSIVIVRDSPVNGSRRRE